MRKVSFILAFMFSLLASPVVHAAPEHSSIFLMTNEYEVGLANQLLIIIRPDCGFDSVRTSRGRGRRGENQTFLLSVQRHVVHNRASQVYRGSGDI